MIALILIIIDLAYAAYYAVFWDYDYMGLHIILAILILAISNYRRNARLNTFLQVLINSE